MQPDPRRFRGPGIYEEPVQQDLPLGGIAVAPPTPSQPAAEAAPATQASPAAARARPLAAWEQKAPQVREYAFEVPQREFAAPAAKAPGPPAPQIPFDLFSRRKR